MSGSYGKAPAYVSPFVADALYRAKLRANTGKPKRAAARTRPPHDESIDSISTAGGWDSSVARNNLFDPKLHKQELFKLPLRKPPNPRSKVEHDDFKLSERKYSSELDKPERNVEADSEGGASVKRLTRRRVEVRNLSMIFCMILLCPSLLCCSPLLRDSRGLDYRAQAGTREDPRWRVHMRTFLQRDTVQKALQLATSVPPM